jgi:signal transduction histidine kinase
LADKNRPDKKRINWRGFSLQLFLITFLPLTVLLLIVAFGSQTLHQEAMRSLVGDRDLQAVRATANSLDHELSHRASMIQVEARSLNGATDFSKLILRPEEVGAVFDGGLAIFSEDGKFIGATNSTTEWQSVITQLPGYLEMALKNNGQPVFSKPFLPGAGNNILVMVGSISGTQEILVGAFSPSTVIQDAVSSLVSAGQTTVLVVAPGQGGESFRVIYRAGPDKADESTPAHPGIQEALNGESGINYFQSGQGEHVVAFSPIITVGWGLVIEEAWEDISSPYLATTQSAPLVIVPVFLLALVALWFGARRIVQPLQALEKRAGELAMGDFNAIQEPVGGILEIQHLQAQLIDMAQRVNSAQNSLHSYIGAITSGIENERRNLARELHDDTIQALIALNQRIQLPAISNNDLQNQATEKELRKLVQQTMLNLRRIIRGLRPIYLEDLGLVAALGMLGQEVSQSAALPIDFTANGVERRLEPTTELAIYRIAQEALNNVTRHANAKQVWMEINYASSYLQLSVKDDGTGFVVPDQPGFLTQGGHFGLLGLRERAELIKGDVEVTSSPGKGTTVSVRLDYPLP